jgi:ketosteroid isomerase-like protein
MPVTTQLRNLAERYTAAWNSQQAASVAAFYSPQGSLRVNADAPAVGRDAITKVAQGFMTAFPDMRVFMDGLTEQGDQFVYRWTLAGTNTGPEGRENACASAVSRSGASAPMGSSPSRKATSTAPNTSASWNEASPKLGSLPPFTK